MLENFVLRTMWIFDLVISHVWLIEVIWVSIMLTTIVLFVYHLQSYYELDFFMEHVDVLGEFSMASYKIFMVLFAIVPILGGMVIIWSVAEGLDSRKFLARFGCP